MSTAVEAPSAPWGSEPGMRPVWPTRVQGQLLRAALLPDERALLAFHEIRPQLVPERIDASVQAVLPRLRANLRALGVEDELMGLLNGVHRYVWVRNQLLLRASAPVLEALESRGIPTMLLKGAAQLAAGRGDAGLRYMTDVDVLVPTARAGAAVEALGVLGWQPVAGKAAWYVTDRAPLHSPSFGFRDSDHHELDLHWHVLHASCQPEADDDFWAAAAPARLHGIATQVLCATDELLLAIEHGLRFNPVPSYSWVLDAALLIRQPIDWDRLVAQAAKRRLELVLAAGLRCLRTLVEAPVPDNVLRALRRVAPLQRAELRAELRDPHERRGWQWTVLYHQQYARRYLPLRRRSTPLAHLGLARRRLTRR